MNKTDFGGVRRKFITDEKRGNTTPMLRQGAFNDDPSEYGRD